MFILNHQLTFFIFWSFMNIEFWEIFHAFCCLLIFFKINLFKKLFQEYHLSVIQIGSRPDLTFDLGPNCLQKLSADDTRR